VTTHEETTTVDAEHPWPGLMPFTEEAQAFFNGRDAEVGDLLRLIRRDTLTVLFGQSGLGKSSLINAGASPRLRAEDYFPIYLRLDFSDAGRDVLEQVWTTIASSCREHAVDAPAPAPGETLWEFFHRRDTHFWSARNRLLTPVLFFDQFEEIFTLGRHGEGLEARCRALIAELADLIEDRMPDVVAKRVDADPALAEAFDFAKHVYKVVFSFREDYLPEFEDLAHLIRPIMHNRMRLARMTGEQAFTAIMRSGGQLVTAPVAEQIVRFVAAPRPGRSSSELSRLEIEPALLSVVCRELNGRRIRNGQARIGVELLQGGLQEQIIHDFYENSLRDLDSSVRVFIEDRLLTEAGYRDSCALDDAIRLPGVTRDAIGLLVGRRVLRLEDRSGVLRVELTHDLLTRVVQESRDRRKRREEEARRIQVEEARRRRTRRLAFVGGVGFAAAVSIALVFAKLLERANEERRHLIDTQSFVMLARANAAVLQDIPGDAYAMVAQAIRLNPGNRAAVTRAVTLLGQRSHGRLLLQARLKAPAAGAWYDKSGFVLFLQRTVAWLDVDRAEAARPAVVRSTEDDYEDYGLLDLTYGQPQPVVQIPFAEATRQDSGRARHATGIHSYHPDARVIAVVTRNLMVHLFDPGSGQRVGRALQLSRNPQWLAVSPARKWLTAVSGSGEVRLAALDGSRRHDGGIRPAASGGDNPIRFVSDEGKLLVSSAEGVLLYGPRSADSGLGAARMLGESFDAVRLDPAGEQFAAALHGKVWVFGTSTGAQVGGPFEHPNSVRDLAFSPDGRTLATACLDKYARVWDLAAGQLAAPPLRHNAAVLAVRFLDARGELATGSADGALRIWDAARGNMIVEPMVHPDPVVAVLPQPDGNRVLSLTYAGDLFLWSWDTQTRRLNLPIPMPSSSLVASSRDGALVAVAGDGGHVAVVATGGPQRGQGTPAVVWNVPATAAAPGVVGLQFSPDGALLAIADGAGGVELRQAKSGRSAGKLPEHTAAVTALRFSHDGRLLAIGSTDGITRIWDIERRDFSGLRMPHAGELVSIAFSPDDRLLLTAGGGMVRLWDIHDTVQRQEWAVPTSGRDQATLGAFLPDGRAIVVLADNEVVKMQLLGAPVLGASMLDTAPGAQRLALGDMRIWAAAVSEGAKRIAIGALDGRVRVVDLERMRFVGETMRHEDAVLGLEFSSDGKTLVSWSVDRSVRLWDAVSGYAIADPVVADVEPTAVGLVGDGKAVVVAIDKQDTFLQPIGIAPASNPPPWLVPLVEAVGGSFIDESGATARIVDRVGAYRALSPLPDTSDIDWKTWALGVLESVGGLAAREAGKGAQP
jgi:WD40 repeat protein